MAEIRVGEWTVDPARGTVERDGSSVSLQPKVMEVLVYLTRHPGKVLSKDRLIQAVWPDTFVSDWVLSHAISVIRKTLRDDARNPSYIETVPKRGYRLIAEVTDASTRDAPHDVVGEETGRGTAGEVHRWYRSRRLWARFGLALVVMLATGLLTAGLLRIRLPISLGDSGPVSLAPLTAYPELETQATFSPDGTHVAFVRGDGWTRGNIWVKQVGFPEAEAQQRTRSGMDHSPAWSPQGDHIAFLRSKDPIRSSVMLMLSSGGPQHSFLEVQHAASSLGPLLCWSRDGNWLIVSGQTQEDPGAGLIAFSPKTREVRRLTRVHAPFRVDCMPVVSPDGRSLAFVRSGTADFGTVNVVNVSEDLRPLGEPRSLTDAQQQIVGLTWSSDGQEVICAAGVIPRMRLWRQNVVGDSAARPLEFTGTGVARPVLSGGRLAFESFIAEKNIWLQSIDHNGEPIGERKQFASSSRWDSFPSFSPDGRRIVFMSSRSGTRQLWICDKDGTGLRPLTSLPDTKVADARWSPSGQEIAFGARPEGSGEIYVVEVESGALRKVTDHPADDTQPSWSVDGKWIYFNSNREPPGLWMIPPRKGTARKVRGRELGTSPDGRWTFFLGGQPERSEVWKEPTAGGESIPIPKLRGCQFPVLLEDRIFYVAFESVDATGSSFTIRCYDTITDENKTIADIEGSFGFGFTVSPDGSTILYSAFDMSASDLMLAENFR